MFLKVIFLPLCKLIKSGARHSEQREFPDENTLQYANHFSPDEILVETSTQFFSVESKTKLVLHWRQVSSDKLSIAVLLAG